PILGVFGTIAGEALAEASSWFVYNHEGRRAPTVQGTRAQWFRDVCWVLVVWFGAYSIHASALSVELLCTTVLQFLGPTVAYAQPAPDPALLASTPDANSTDPYIVAKATELGHDPQQIFAFVRDEIGYESYKGSLRGARGTLWSKAGNALDKASLLIALLRASNIPARYVQ